jgi:hypothetical protein
MKTEEKAGILAIILLILGSLMIPVFGQVETGQSVMNASLAQVITIQVSGNLTNGIFFTNGSQNNTQYNITNMTIWNNAIYNYPDNNQGNTSYWVKSTSTSTNITVCQCPCGNLLCAAGGLCTAGVDFLNITYGCEGADTGGIAFGNSTDSSNTGANVGTTPGSSPNNKGFRLPTNFTVIGAIVNTNYYVNLRYWLDPYPNTRASGVYNATYKLRAVESPGTVAGNCSANNICTC